MLSTVHELTETNRENDKVNLEQSLLVVKAGGSSKDVENIGEGLNVSGAMGKSMPVLQDVVVEDNQKDVEIVSNDTNQVESDAEEMEQDESDGEGFDETNRSKGLYSWEEIHNFLDETFGQSVKVDDYFADTEKIIRSVP